MRYPKSGRFGVCPKLAEFGDNVPMALNVGLIGTGGWAQVTHAPAIAAHPGTTLTAVYGRNPDKAAAIAQPHGAAVATSVPELLDQVDAVAFAVPPALQADWAIQAAGAGKHLILDKPLAPTATKAAEVLEAVEQAGVASIMLLTQRFAPQTRDWLSEVDRTGGWVAGSVRFVAGGLLDPMFKDSQWRQEDLGALLDLGPHSLDLAEAALGPVREVASAQLAGQGLMTLALSHESGAVSTVTMALRIPDTAAADVVLWGEHGERRLELWQATAQECYSVMLDEFLSTVDSPGHPCDARRGYELQVLIELITNHLKRN
ncbi:gfo/Idh/MocA family oxidoreductase [Pseudonocardiaceae bacterium YIM PH 21723]|nr:gfo/Idh/MocA family oxidoreductase [Pseudonocardiaceae bacterium YIM PH 21723]